MGPPTRPLRIPTMTRQHDASSSVIMTRHPRARASVFCMVHNREVDMLIPKTEFEISVARPIRAAACNRGGGYTRGAQTVAVLVLEASGLSMVARPLWPPPEVSVSPPLAHARERRESQGGICLQDPKGHARTHRQV